MLTFIHYPLYTLRWPTDSVCDYYDGDRGRVANGDSPPQIQT